LLWGFTWTAICKCTYSGDVHFLALVLRGKTLIVQLRILRGRAVLESPCEFVILCLDESCG